MSTAAEGTPPFASDDTASPEERAAHLRAIEEEIRRKVVAERAANLAAAQQAQSASSSSQQPWVVDLPASRAPAQQAPPLQRKPTFLDRWKERGGVLGGLASVLIVLAKFAGPLIAILAKAKFLLTLLSMGAYMWAEAQIAGWVFGVGFVLLIFIHECGHVWASRRLGLRVGGMMFIPFLGAYVTHQRARNMADTAFVAIMGPVFGGLGGILCYGLFLLTGRPVFLFLGMIDLGMNLFNLIPMPPMDGSKVWPVCVGSSAERRYASTGDSYYRVSYEERRQYAQAYGAVAALLAVFLFFGFLGFAAYTRNGIPGRSFPANPARSMPAPVLGMPPHTN